MGLTCMINEAFAAIFIKQVIWSLDIAKCRYHMIHILHAITMVCTVVYT